MRWEGTLNYRSANSEAKGFNQIDGTKTEMEEA